jgi:phosphoserine phosphatase
MHLIIQGVDIETRALKEIAKAAGASGIEQVQPNVFRLIETKVSDGIAELCARHGLECTIVEDPGQLSSRP